ncbi:unnamed protein product [Candidula unifasciata]|uniref:Coiled-coil SMC6 And NSE5 INteracting (CANIN) domain-containing protein n=1 Tax=Candidula unifasciata TaxID=100452 RepID=A0A8S3YLL6_9EUPU|nr:unnamed protein product [Candidula unifasciata]
MLSDSEEELYEAPDFIRPEFLEEDVKSTRSSSKQHCSRIDALLAEHREAEKQQILRDQLLAERESGCEEISKVLADKDIMPEHTDVIEKMKVKSIKVKTVQPGLPIFNIDNFCCLFSDNITPLNYLKNADSVSNNRWSKFSLDDLDVLTAQNLPSIMTSSSFSAVVQWLFDLLSIHQCSRTAVTIETTLNAALSRHYLSRNVEYCWKLSALDLLRLLVNLVEDSTLHRPQERGVSSERFRAVLCVLSVALQGRSLIAKEDLNLMLYMLAKAALDHSLDRTLSANFRHCFLAIINHYSESDWPSVVPELCRRLSKVTDHHHNQAYLASIICSQPRASYLQMLLSYVFLYNLLMCKPLKLEDSKLLQLQLMDVIELGVPVQRGQPSTLVVKLHHLVKKDLYKTYSVLKLLEMSIGDITSIAAAQKKHLEYLLNQMNHILETIRDRVHELDLSTVKDKLYDLTVKWSVALQHQRMNEGSIFSWATATNHQRVQAEILIDRKENTMTDRGDD